MNQKDKRIIIINGKGGSGKDTCVKFVTDYYAGHTMNVSTVDPIKKAASLLGWNKSKDNIDRKFLSDLKQISSDYNDYPNKYTISKIDKFSKLSVTWMRFMFIHCREPENIQLLETYLNTLNVKHYTLLIRRPGIEDTYGNNSDDNVENYNYDFIYENNYASLDAYRRSFMKFFNENIVGEEYHD